MADSVTSLSLLFRARQRDAVAWERLVYLYAPLVEYWCRGWGVQGVDAEDIRQEVFGAVSANLEGFRRDRPGDTFRGWLRVIARRKFLDFCRRRKHQPHAEGGSDALALLPADTQMEGDDPPEQIKAVHRRALELVRSEFEERTWQAFWRCAVEGQLPADIAHDMGVTPAAVRKAKSRVLRRLKEELGEVLE